jgi:hypothetical protein
LKTQKFYIVYLVWLILNVTNISQVYSQTAPPTPTCVACGGRNGNHATSCPYYNPPAGKPKGGSPNTGMPGQINQLNALIDLFNTPADNKEVAAKQDAARKKALEAKQREESLKKERHAREMTTFKPIDDDPNVVRIDNQSGSGLSLKALPSAGAPMTMEERERQNIIKQGLGVTWNFNEFSYFSSDNQIQEPAPDREISENEKLVNDVIAEIESHGGRMAAVTARYMLNVKDGVMSYLDDATYAVTSGNIYNLQETGEFDVKKITTNALYKTASQTAKVYYESALSDVKSGLTNESIAIMKNTALNKMEVYKYSDNFSKAWKKTP